MLDRILVKLRASGHRVLLFSTMTRLLDILENYIQWRAKTPAGAGMEYCRIDGRGLHSHPFQLNLSSSVHRITQCNTWMCPGVAQVEL